MNSDRFAELAMAETQGSLCDKLTIVELKQWCTRQDAKRTTFAANQVFAEQAKANCELWHQQEKVYEFEAVPADQRVSVVKKLGVLKIERTRCIDAIDAIDAQLLELVDRKEQMV